MAFEKREIKTGRSDNTNIEILYGLKEGEQYVAKNGFLLKAELNKESTEHEH